MQRHGTHILAATAAVILAALGTAQASETFSWNPRAVKLDGSKFTADTLLLGDYDRIVLGSGGTTFTEAGYLPIEGFSLAGQPVTPAGFNDPSGKGWGAYVQYTGSGIQVPSQFGTPEAIYSRLNYRLIGYNGSTPFSVGAGAVGRNTNDLTILERGSLIAGQLTFVPFVPTPFDLTIEGSVAATLEEVKPQFAVGQVSGFDLSIVHPPSDYSFTSPTTIQVASTSGASATLQSSNGKVSETSLADLAEVQADPPSAVPEPASVLLLGMGLLGTGALRRKRGRRLAQGRLGPELACGG
jgi:hypothetical protein